jgi:hypothetical protein
MPSQSGHDPAVFVVAGLATGKVINEALLKKFAKDLAVAGLTISAELKIDGQLAKYITLHSWDIRIPPPSLSFRAAKSVRIAAGTKRYNHCVRCTLTMRFKSGFSARWTWRSITAETKWAPGCHAFACEDGAAWNDMYHVEGAFHHWPVHMVPDPSNIAAFMDASDTKSYYVIAGREACLTAQHKDDAYNYIFLNGSRKLAFDPCLLAAGELEAPYGKLPERAVVKARLDGNADVPAVAFIRTTRAVCKSLYGSWIPACAGMTS